MGKIERGELLLETEAAVGVVALVAAVMLAVPVYVWRRLEQAGVPVAG